MKAKDKTDKSEIKKSDNKEESESQEALDPKDIEADIEIGILNLIVVDEDEYELEVIKNEKDIRDFHSGKLSTEQILDKYKADVIIFGNYAQKEDKIDLNLKVQSSKLDEAHVEYSNSINQSVGVYPLVNDFVDKNLSDITSPLKDNAIGVRFGYPLYLSSFISSIKTDLPWLSFYYRHTFLDNRSFLLEYELGIFSFKNNDENIGYLVNNIPTAGTIRSYNFPVIVSLIYQVNVSSWLKINPKVGLGYMLTLSKAPSEADTSSSTSSFLIAKPALEFNFMLSNNFGINIENSFLTAFQMTNFKMLMIYNPNIAFQYSY